MEKIIVSAEIDAGVEKVWDYYTNPVHIVNWNFADPSWCCPKAENDMRLGGKYFARMEAKDGSAGFDFEAVYTNMEMGKSFIYEFGGRVATVTFEKLSSNVPENSKTKITVSFDPESENSVELQRQGWQSILNNFKNYIENN